MSDFIDSYRGSVNTWECDDVGHMNVQFYVARASDAAFYLRHALGLSPSQIHEEGRAMVALEEHFRFLRELRAGDMMNMRSRVIDLREKTLVSYHELLNSATGDIAATCIAVSRHLDLEARKLITWPREAHEKAKAITAPLPDHAQPRSVTREVRMPHITLAEAEARGFIEIYRGAVMPWECDDFGHMNSRFYMGRFSDGAGHLWQAVGMEKTRLQKEHRGTVVLEMRLNYLNDVRSGMMLIVKSTLTRMENKTLTFVHYMFDAETGMPVATGEAVAVMLDLKARRTVNFTDEDRARIAPHIRVLER